MKPLLRLTRICTVILGYHQKREFSININPVSLNLLTPQTVLLPIDDGEGAILVDLPNVTRPEESNAINFHPILLAICHRPVTLKIRVTQSFDGRVGDVILSDQQFNMTVWIAGRYQAHKDTYWNIFHEVALGIFSALVACSSFFFFSSSLGAVSLMK